MPARSGWQTGLFTLYGRATLRTYKTFLATYKPVGGMIRVVLVREPDRWVAYFATDPNANVASILEAVADRSSLEQVFHDVKEVHGAGQQQLRHVWANVGAWNLIGWWHTLVELWAWHRPHAELCDRSESPWDKMRRRPSHADRCRQLRHQALEEEYSHLPAATGLHRKSAGSSGASCRPLREAGRSGKVQCETHRSFSRKTMACFTHPTKDRSATISRYGRTELIWTEFVMSLTAANWRRSRELATPNAPPCVVLIENCPTNLPVLVNSTSSLGWFGSGLIASPLAVIRLPSPTKVRPSGPRRWALSW